VGIAFIQDLLPVAMRKLFVLIVMTVALLGVVVVLPSATAQKSVTPVASKLPFESEQLFYEAEFSRSILRKLDVADFKFSAARTLLSHPASNASDAGNDTQYSLVFNADISSKGFFTRLFNLNFRERVESIVEPSSFTVQRTKIHDQQGKRVRTTETVFDRAKGKMSWTQRDPNNPSGEPRHVVTDFSGQLQDVLSAIYFIRTQPLEVGKSFEIFIGDGGRVYKVPVKVTEKKRMKTILGRVEVVKVDPELFGPDRLIEDEKGQFSLWVTNDHRRIPVSAKVKTDYGTFDIKLKRIVSPG
jgi:Protein of unknown function (DUF3108)